MQVANKSGNGIMNQFIFDYYCYKLTPRWLPTVLCALCTVSPLVILDSKYHLYIRVLLGLVCATSSFSGFQISILKESSRLPHGWAWGVIAVIGANHFVYVSPHVGAAVTIVASMLLLASMYSLFVVSKSTVSTVPPDNNNKKWVVYCYCLIDCLLYCAV